MSIAALISLSHISGNISCGGTGLGTTDFLRDVGNVNTTDVTKAAGHVIIWDNTQSRWENAAITGTAHEVDVTLGDGSVQIGFLGLTFRYLSKDNRGIH